MLQALYGVRDYGTNHHHIGTVLHQAYRLLFADALAAYHDAAPAPHIEKYRVVSWQLTSHANGHRWRGRT